MYELIHADCRHVLANMADNSVDSVVSDPPYHLTSIVKRFGAANAAPAQFGSDGAYARASRGFMGKTWDGGDIAFDASLWAEVLRVLKPGGHLLAFGGSRTYHRLACAIEDAGFEIRDQVLWLYGSGFPKSHDIGEGRGTALKPAHEPIVMARKPLVGTVAANVAEWGTGAIAIDACRVPPQGKAPQPAVRGGFVSSYEAAKNDWGQGAAYRPHDLGRFPANLIHDGSDEVLAVFPAEAGAAAAVTRRNADKFRGTYGRFAGNVDETGSTYRGDSGSAARFFYCAKASKADREAGLQAADGERGNTHPTVKPTELMRYLVRLVTPPGGLVFDPFTGSGSTGRAALLEGCRFIGAELTAEYIPIAHARICDAWAAVIDGNVTPR